MRMRHHSTTNTHEDGERGGLFTLELRRLEDRDVALIVAHEPLLSEIAERARRSDLRAAICSTYIEALEHLDRERERIACVVILLDYVWAADLYRVVAQRDPMIRRYAVVV